jgi:hypothetical protein
MTDSPGQWQRDCFKRGMRANLGALKEEILSSGH